MKLCWEAMEGRSGVMCEGSSYIYPPSKIAVSRSNGSGIVSQLCHGPVVTYCMVYHYTKRAMLARLLANEGPAIYVVHLNRYFVIPP